MSDIVREMLISHDPSETRVAVLEDGRLVEYYIERAKRSVVGNVYVALVKDVLPGMQAAFVDIGLAKNAFLYVDEVVAPEGVEDVPRRDIQSMLKPGQRLIVQVLRDPMGTKGARVTTEVSLPGRYLVLMPFSEFIGISRKLPEPERDRLHEIVTANAPAGAGVIVRTAAAGSTERDLLSDLDFLQRLWKRVQAQALEAVAPEVVYTEMDLALKFVRDVFCEDFSRLVDDKVIHEKVVGFLKRTSPTLARLVQLHREPVPMAERYDLDAQSACVLERVVRLPSGGYIAIDTVEALTAIDVNTGKFTGRTSLEETIRQTNLEAADEVVRQLRLRDIGGIIVIDFIDMDEQANRADVFARLIGALDRDRTKTRVMEMSRLGMVEMTRKNTTDGLTQVLTEPCPTCHGEGRVLSHATRRIMAERRMREVLRGGKSAAYLFGLHPETYAIVSAPGQNIVASLRAETKKQVAMVPDPDCGPGEVRTLIEGRAGSIERALG